MFLYRKKIVPLLGCMLLCMTFSCSQQEKAGNLPQPARYTASIQFTSKILGRPLRYSVILPASYYDQSKQYATVYLLHGFGDNETSWVKDGKIDKIITEYEDAGKIEPMIYIMPQGFNSYYVDRENGTLDYMKMFTDEFVPMIDSLYRTRKEGSQRAVVGYSMGGYGALILPSKNPRLFSVSVPLSMSFRTDRQYMDEPQSVFDQQWASIFGGIGTSGESRLTPYYKEYSPFHYFEDNNGQYAGIHYYIDCGDDEESLSVTNDQLHLLMRDQQIAHEYRVRNGAHTWDYWRGAMREALVYIQYCFGGQAYPEEPEIHLSETFTGEYTLVSATVLGMDLGVCLPEVYQKNNESYPVIYFFHSVRENRDKESRQMLAVLDSLQKEKPFILVEIDEAEYRDQRVTFAQVINYVDSHYRTRIKRTSRIGIGNNKGGSLLYSISAQQSDLLYSAFLFDAPLNVQTEIPAAGFYYIGMTDGGNAYQAAGDLYNECRTRGIDHQYRVRNGKNTYPSFIGGLEDSRVYIGLMLNKL